MPDRKCGFFFLATLLPVSVFGFDLGISPRIDGTFVISASHEFAFGTRFYSYFDGEFETLKENSESYESNLTSTFESQSIDWNVGGDLFGFRFTSESFDFGLASFARFIHFDARENAIYQADEGYEIMSGVNELQVNNNRTLFVFLPGASMGFDIKHRIFGFRLGIEYAPIIIVRLLQI